MRRRRGPRTNGAVKQTFTRHFTYDVPANYTDPLVYGFGINISNHDPDARVLTTIYDEYKITKCKVTIRPDFKNRTEAIPMEVLTIDHDDHNISGQTFVGIINYAGARIARVGYKSKTWVPKFKAGAVLANGNLVAAQVKGGWLDSLNTDVEHNGYKIAYQNSFINTNSIRVSVTEKIWIMYRHKR